MKQLPVWGTAGNTRWLANRCSSSCGSGRCLSIGLSGMHCSIRTGCLCIGVIWCRIEGLMSSFFGCSVGCLTFCGQGLMTCCSRLVFIIRGVGRWLTLRRSWNSSCRVIKHCWVIDFMAGFGLNFLRLARTWFLFNFTCCFLFDSCQFC